MLTFRRLQLVVALAALASGCERTSASTDVDADLQSPQSQAIGGSASAKGSDQPIRAILGLGDEGFVPKFTSSHTIGNSEIFEANGKIIIGGTANTCCRLQVQDDFIGGGTILNIHQVSPTGHINLEFSRSGVGVLGDIGVVQSGGPERLVILSSGRNPRRIPLALAEGDGNVGIGTSNPEMKLDVVGSTRVRGDLTVFDGRVHLGGTATPAGRLQVSDNFPGFGPTGQILMIHQIDPTGRINIEFSQTAVGGSRLLGNIGVIRDDGRPERFVIQGGGRVPTSLPLTLREDGGNVGIGTADPRATLDVVGNTRITGNLSVTGTKSSVATLSDGRRVLLYAIESPKNWFEDFGTGQLRNGEAWVPLDGVFAETVNTDVGYHVFLTPHGDCKGLYIAERRADGFIVRELGRGRSNVSFDYRIVAARRGLEDVRLMELR